jgi:hypothetical protein
MASTKARPGVSKALPIMCNIWLMLAQVQLPTSELAGVAET